MFAPGIPELMAEFKSRSTELGSFVVSVYVLGFAVGPLIFAPLSELYGRVPIYHVCNVCFLAFTIACALATDLNMMIAFRFLAGVFGSAPLTNGKHLIVVGEEALLTLVKVVEPLPTLLSRPTEDALWPDLQWAQSWDPLLALSQEVI
jgi:MFS family permease